MSNFRDQRYEMGFPEGEGAALPLGHRNRYHAAWNFFEGRTLLDTVPTSLQVARNNLCNFKCVYCTDHFPGNTMPRSLIQDAAWEELVELLPRAEMVAFHGISEFMIDPRFFEIVELCAQHRLSLSINTNGSVCTPAHLELLGNYPGFLDLFVSLDAATPATGRLLADLFVSWTDATGATRFVPNHEPVPFPWKVGLRFPCEMPHRLTDRVPLDDTTQGPIEICAALFVSGALPNISSNCFWSQNVIVDVPSSTTRA